MESNSESTYPLSQITTTQLLAAPEVSAKYTTRKPKEELLDQAQRAYLRLKAEHGLSYIITARSLQTEMGCPESTFNDNFSGGVNGFLSLSERIVADRFGEAVEKAEPELVRQLSVGLRALYTVDPHSRYNIYKQTVFDMNLRTRFAAEVFSPDYWKKVMEPLFPAMDSFLAEKVENWHTASGSVRDELYSLYAGGFQWVIRLFAREDLSRYPIKEQAGRRNDYIAIIKKLLLAQGKTLLDDRYHFETEIMRTMAEIKQNEQNATNVAKNTEK